MPAQLPTVPLEAGLSPENPPCPACGEPLFVWVLLPVDSGISHRCEACGLGVLAEPGDTEDALRDFDTGATGDGAIVYENRDSLQASFAGGAWAGLVGDHRYSYTPEAVRRLVASRDQVVAGASWMPLAGMVSMWQSGVNMFTFGHNLALGRLGRATATRASRRWQRWLDGFITVAVALPVILFAVPLELVGGLFRRGGRYRVTLKVL